MKRVLALLPVLLAFQVGVSPALAWTWPVDGPVLQPFAFDPDSPYAGGQHRGIDVGAPTGTPVVAPAAGTVSFAGTVPGGGLTLAIRTPDGYSVTLVHLGAIGAARGATVREGEVVGSVGPTGESELPEPYVHLGIRVAADEQGYVDPLSLLPVRGGAPPEDVPATVDEAPATPEVGDTEEPAGGTPADSRNTPAADSGDTPAADSGNEAGTSSSPAARTRSRRQRRVGQEAAYVVRLPATVVLLPRVKRLVTLDRSLPLLVPSAPATSVAKRSPDEPSWILPALLLVAVSAVAAGLAARRQLRDARLADGAAAVLSERRAASAKDTDRLRLGEKDDVLAHGDLERVLLAEAEAFADLDRDHDATEFVDVADDPRRAGPLLGPCGHGPRGRSRSHRRRPTPLSTRSLI
jgi:peptidase M23-like protein